MEAVAAEKYARMMLQRHHKEFKTEVSGLYISHRFPFLGASPDRLTQCTCCGHGLLEIKCPYRCVQTAPSPEVLD